MSAWTFPIASTNEWTDPANWSDGIPDPPFWMASFHLPSTGSNWNINISEASAVTVGELYIDLNDSPFGVGITFRGSLADSGTGIAELRFDSYDGGPGAIMEISYDIFNSGPVIFSSLGGLRMTLVKSLTIRDFGGPAEVQFNLPISGEGGINVNADGTIFLNGLNTFSGGLNIVMGKVRAASDAALGSGAIMLGYGGVFDVEGMVDNPISTIANNSPFPGTARLESFGTGAVFTGTLSHLSAGKLAIGAGISPITASFGSILHNPNHSGLILFSGVVKFGNAYNAANLFNFAGTGNTLITLSKLDTAGFATTISNLWTNAGTIQSSGGALNVIVNDATLGAVQHGTVIGTTSADSFTVNALWDVQNTDLEFNSWTAGTDTITYNGSANGNTIVGSVQRETFNGGAGNDIMVGGGGIDAMNGGSGNDLIVLVSGNQGSFIDGGADTDTLRISGGLITLGSLAEIEKVNFQNAGVLILTAAQFASGLTTTTQFSGAGSMQVDLSLGNQQMLARSMTVSAGSFVDFTVNGSSGADVVKASIDTPATIFGNAGSDRLNGGDQVDTINGGNDIDKIRGDGGADILTGGAGADVFKYRAIADSGTTAGTRDTITDFLAGTDRLNFVRIDANASLAGDQAFTFINTAAFTNTGLGQIRWVDLGADLKVEVDVDGNGVADMHILLQGAGAQVLTAADFVL
jgi:hypothetical protein